MEELLFRLEVVILIRKAVSQTYNSVKDSSKLIECVSLIDDVEERIVNEIVTEYTNKDGS